MTEPTSYSFGSGNNLSNNEIYEKIKTNCTKPNMNAQDYNECLKDVIYYDIQVKSTENKNKYDEYTLNINKKHYDLSNNIQNLYKLNKNQNNYDMIDNKGNLLHETNYNFKETIPSLKDAVFEDTNNLVNYQNNIYVFSSIVAVSLIITSIYILQK